MRLVAGGAVRRAAGPSAGGRLPDARLARRGGRRRAGRVAALSRRRHRRGREPRRLADDGRGPGVPEDAARPPQPRARSRWACTCPTGHRPRGGPARAGSAAGRLGRPGAAGRAGHPRPAERLAFVLHDMFGVPFDQIAPIVGRTPAAARSSPAAPAAGSRGRHPVRRPISPASERWWAPSSGRPRRGFRGAGRGARPGRRAAGRRGRPAPRGIRGDPRRGGVAGQALLRAAQLPCRVARLRPALVNGAAGVVVGRTRTAGSP